ncbi:DUF397 domain-containing protein [Streptomyces sp. NPDC059142]|uniref:DUF397 domain-containing protein n=1 Tax=Streptomyces sp. NPDC059142 TaxID=3346739 RepID=UPI0036BA4621
MPLSRSTWHKSTYSGDFEDACVEARVRPADTGVLIRDSKEPRRLPLTFSAEAWHTFLTRPAMVI